MNHTDIFGVSWKVVFIVLLLLFGFPAFIFASNSEGLSEQQVIDLLCSGKWHLTYMEMDGQHLDFPENEVKANWTNFKSDGTHDAEEMGEAYSGTWTYNHNTKTLTTKDKDGEVDLVVITINESEIKLSLVDEGKKMIVGMRK